MASGSPNSISVQIARGCYQFKVENSKTKEIGIGEFVTTPKFSAGGHIWRIKYYPDGSDANKKGTYISLCLQLLTTSTSTSVTAEYELGLLNKYGTLDMNMSSTVLYQHLLVAADRYALEGLKTLCVERLCRMISIDTVVSSLAVAEQHNCNDLKKECLEFIAKPKNFVLVALSKEYVSLASTCPSLLDELRRKINYAADHKRDVGDILRLFWVHMNYC
ncbi:BTB/POZ and MATH domain-containing protein 2 [Carex littledalei]|uniref:BTB/POZ and MATH domain-containing protein 2 n=1 Tax=Carex littledalei TaxID=544730 RepID=A0A833W2W7_9POAL|nr:BTB/POZ and MATH domain-containing protein 2 [Carex littledalei]